MLVHAETLTGRLQLAQSVLDVYAAELARRTGGSSALTLHDADLVEHLYQKHAGKVRRGCGHGGRPGGRAAGVAGVQAQSIARVVLEAVTPRYEPHPCS